MKFLSLKTEKKIIQFKLPAEYKTQIYNTLPDKIKMSELKCLATFNLSN